MSIIHWGTVKGEIGSKVSGGIDWDKRYSLHATATAGHLLDHCLGQFSKVPIETSDSWLGEAVMLLSRSSTFSSNSIRSHSAGKQV